MKKFLRIIGIFFFVVVLMGGTALVFRLGTTDDKPATEGYTITYRMIITNEENKEAIIYKGLFNKNGNYPKSYNSEDGAVVSELEKITFTYEGKDYVFQGWYLNKECTATFDGTINPGTTGDITLYAKVSHGSWSGFY